MTWRSSAANAATWPCGSPAEKSARICGRSAMATASSSPPIETSSRALRIPSLEENSRYTVVGGVSERSLIASTVDAVVGAAIDAGATTIKPVKKGLWGYGGVVRAPDGTIWKIATSAKKDTGPATRQVDDIVLLLGCADVAATKQFYVERGLTVARGFGSKYVEFAAPASHIKLALYKRRALAKDAGVPPEGTGSHRIAITSDTGPFTDPDGFGWEAGA